MSIEPSSRFVTLPDRPLIGEKNEICSGPLTLHYWEWTGNLPTILFCHATSFHGRCYDEIIVGAFRDHRVISLDLRGHGRSTKHSPPYRFPWFGEDVLRFIEKLQLENENLIGIGHSLGGYALTWAAAASSKRLFRMLLLVDPGIVPRSCYGLGDERVEALEYIRRRRNQWKSLEEMISRLEQREPYSKWSKIALRNYSTYALDENARLQCDAESEYSMYMSGLASHSNIYPMIEQSKVLQETPVRIIRSSLPLIIGRFDTSIAPADLVKYFRNGHDTYLTNAEHLFPMDQPKRLIDWIKEQLKEPIRSKL